MAAACSSVSMSVVVGGVRVRSGRCRCSAHQRRGSPPGRSSRRCSPTRGRRCRRRPSPDVLYATAVSRAGLGRIWEFDPLSLQSCRRERGCAGRRCPPLSRGTGADDGPSHGLRCARRRRHYRSDALVKARLGIVGPAVAGRPRSAVSGWTGSSPGQAGRTPAPGEQPTAGGGPAVDPNATPR